MSLILHILIVSFGLIHPPSTGGTLVKGRRDVFVSAEVVDQVIVQVEALAVVVNELQQKCTMIDSTVEKNLDQFGFRLVNIEQTGKSTREEVRNFENKIDDRLQVIQNELMLHKNMTDNLTADYCKSMMKGLEGLNNGGSEFCTQKTQKLNFRSIPARYILGNVVSKPKARLYKGANYTGNFEDFNFEIKSNPSCLTLSKLYGGVGSLNTFSTCVRLYNHEECWTPWIRAPRTYETPKSVAFYPQLTQDSSLDWTKKEFLKEVKSIGPCFENELDDSQLEVNVHGVKGYRKPLGLNSSPIIPDLVYIGDGGNYEVTTSSRLVHGFRTGYRGRVEFVKASVSHNNILWGQHSNTKQLNVTKEDRDFYLQLDKETDDHLGHFISGFFGLIEEEDLPFHNVFPQSRKNRALMSKLEGRIVEALSLSQNSDRVIYIRINVDYPSRTATRPSGMSYLINFEDGVKSINYLPNIS